MRPCRYPYLSIILATNPKRRLFNPTQEALSRHLLPRVECRYVFGRTSKMGAVSSSRVAHRRDAKKWRRHDGRIHRVQQGVSSLPFPSCALLERNSRIHTKNIPRRLQALGDHLRYCIAITVMILAHTRTSSSLIAAVVTNGLRSSSIGSTISLSRALSTTSGESARHALRYRRSNSATYGIRTPEGPLAEDRA